MSKNGECSIPENDRRRTRSQSNKDDTMKGAKNKEVTGTENKDDKERNKATCDSERSKKTKEDKTKEKIETDDKLKDISNNDRDRVALKEKVRALEKTVMDLKNDQRRRDERERDNRRREVRERERKEREDRENKRWEREKWDRELRDRAYRDRQYREQRAQPYWIPPHQPAPLTWQTRVAPAIPFYKRPQSNRQEKNRRHRENIRALKQLDGTIQNAGYHTPLSLLEASRRF